MNDNEANDLLTAIKNAISTHMFQNTASDVIKKLDKLCEIKEQRAYALGKQHGKEEKETKEETEESYGSNSLLSSQA